MISSATGHTGWRAARAAALWAVAGGTWAGLTWPLGQVITRLTLGHTVFAGPLPADPTEDTLLLAVFGGGCGLVLGAVAGTFHRRPDRVTSVVVLALGFGLTGALGGGLSVPAVLAFAGALHPDLSAGFAWAVAGALAGLGGFAWARWTAEPTGEPDEPIGDFEEHASPAPPGIAWVPAARPLDGRLAAQLFPTLAVAGFALVAAALPAPSPSLSLLATGLLGLTVAVALGSQERRLADLERRSSGHGGLTPRRSPRPVQ